MTTDNITMEEIQKRHDEEALKREAEETEREARRVAEIENCSNMSMGEYVAYRNGTEYKPNESLEGLSMEEYIKARKSQ